MVRRLALPAALLVALLAGCGHKSQPAPGSTSEPSIGFKVPAGTSTTPGAAPAAPADTAAVVTANTVRIPSGDAVAAAAAAATVTYPSGPGSGAHPRAVALVDRRDWRAALAASVFAADPVGAPLLLADGAELPASTAAALKALAPKGAKGVGDAQLIRVGAVPRPAGYSTNDVQGANPFALARAVDAVQAAAQGQTSDTVVVTTADDPAYAMPAASWAAKSGEPILLVHRDAIPADTRAALATHQQPKIYVLGPPSAISPKVVKDLRRLGTVRRVGAQGPVQNAIAFARFRDGAFGWGIVDPGHGFTFVRASADPATAAGVAPLAMAGAPGPLLLLDDAPTLAAPLRQYLLDVQPGYADDPVRGVYNRAWVVGDLTAVPAALQSDLDRLLEIVPVKQRSGP